MINILLTENHHVVREGIKSLLEKDENLKVIAEATNGRQTIELLQKGLNPDIILTCINMPEMNGIEMTALIKADFPKIKVIILSMLDHEKYIVQAFKAGACGYTLKRITLYELVFAIKHVHENNERYICSRFALRMLDKLINQPGVAVLDQLLLQPDFSEREIEVLVLISEGFTNLEIADKLFMSKRTVEGHRQNMIDKTGSRNTAMLIRYAVLSGMIN